MPQQTGSHDGTEQQSPVPDRNPYIMNFLKALVEKKGDEHGPEESDKLLENMHRFFDELLARNLIAVLPEEERNKYLALMGGFYNLNFERIGRIFAGAPFYKQILKATMQQVTDVFLKKETLGHEHCPENCSCGAGHEHFPAGPELHQASV